MSKTKDRDEFVAIMTAEGMPLRAIQALMRAEKTLHRLAELECSSEAADRDRVPCLKATWQGDHGKDGCMCADYGNKDGDTHGTVPRIAVKAWRTERAVEGLLNGLTGWKGADVVFNGDPRGPAILVKVPSGRTNDWGQRGICVP